MLCKFPWLTVNKRFRQDVFIEKCEINLIILFFFLSPRTPYQKNGLKKQHKYHLEKQASNHKVWSYRKVFSRSLLKLQASCEGLSPCTQYVIFVSACSTESGCGEPATLSVSTTPGRKFGNNCFLQWTGLHGPTRGNVISGLCLKKCSITHTEVHVQSHIYDNKDTAFKTPVGIGKAKLYISNMVCNALNKTTRVQNKPKK